MRKVSTQAILLVDENSYDVGIAVVPKDEKFLREVASFYAEVLDDERMGRGSGTSSMLRIESEILAEALAAAVRQCDFLRDTLAKYGYEETLGGANLVATALLFDEAVNVSR